MAIFSRAVVLIPAFNEEKAIRRVAESVLACGYPLIVVNDGSTDGTDGELAGLDVVLINHPANKGKGDALRTGFAEAISRGYDYVVTIDGDGQHHASDIGRLLSHAASHRLVIGSRTKNRIHTPAGRLFANRFANYWLGWVCGSGIVDSQSGFRVYPLAHLAKMYKPDATGDRFSFESALLIAAARQGLEFAYVEIEAIYGESLRASHYRPFYDTLLIVKTVALNLISRGLALPSLLSSFLKKPFTFRS